MHGTITGVLQGTIGESKLSERKAVTLLLTHHLKLVLHVNNLNNKSTIYNSGVLNKRLYLFSAKIFFIAMRRRFMDF